jgi:hypothetical protein
VIGKMKKEGTGCHIDMVDNGWILFFLKMLFPIGENTNRENDEKAKKSLH